MAFCVCSWRGLGNLQKPKQSGLTKKKSVTVSSNGEREGKRKEGSKKAPGKRKLKGVSTPTPTSRGWSGVL